MEKIKYIYNIIKNHIGLVFTSLLLILSSLFSIFLFLEKNKLTNLLEERNKNYNKEIENLRALRDNELRERILIERKYQEQLDRLKQEYQLNLQNLDKDKEKLVKDVLKETKDSPEKAALRINEIFGIPVYKE